MQPGKHSAAIERARNGLDLKFLGDPERWGGTAKLVMRIGADPIEAYSHQIIRVQCADLVARAWDLFCGWRWEGIGGNDVIDGQGLEISFGAGQASWTQILDLRASALGIIPLAAPPTVMQPAVAWAFAPGNQGFAAGAVSLPVPLPAVALAARAIFAAHTPDKEHVIKGHFFVAVSPRALQ